MLNTLRSSDALNPPKSFGIWGGRGKWGGLPPWAWGSLLALVVPKASPPPPQVAREASVRQGTGPCSPSNYSIAIIKKKYKSKHGRIFCLPERGARSFGCLLQALCTRCPRIPKIQPKIPGKRHIFLQHLESCFGWALQCLPLLGKWCLISQCQYFSLQTEGGMD